jgi:hypothetical protein
LDGILVCPVKAQTKRVILELSRTIMKSKQYSQLHAVIVSKNQNLLRVNDVAELAHSLRLPVIMLLKHATRKKPRPSIEAGQYDLRVKDARVQVMVKGISFGGARELFLVGSAADSHVPEAVRVADLIGNQVTLKWHSLGLP